MLRFAFNREALVDLSKRGERFGLELRRNNRNMVSRQVFWFDGFPSSTSRKRDLVG